MNITLKVVNVIQNKISNEQLEARRLEELKNKIQIKKESKTLPNTILNRGKQEIKSNEKRNNLFAIKWY